VKNNKPGIEAFVGHVLPSSASVRHLYCHKTSQLLAATFIPAADAVIVLRQGGSRAIGFGSHGGTAAAMLLVSGLLLRA
jgi:hypothetical protein